MRKGEGVKMSEITKIAVADLPVGMVISTGVYSTNNVATMTITKVTHHKRMRTVHIEGTDTLTGEPMLLRYMEGVEFCL